MLGIMAIPHSFQVYKATGQTLNMSGTNSVEGFVWNPSVDYTPYAANYLNKYWPLPVANGEVDSSQYLEQIYYDEGRRNIYVNVPWLVRVTTKAGEAAIDISWLNMTPYLGNDVGSTPYKVSVLDYADKEAIGYIGAQGEYTLGAEMLTGWTEVVTGPWKFTTFTSSGPDISSMEVNGSTEIQGKAISNALTFVEGRTYRFLVTSTREFSGARPALQVNGAEDIRIVGYFSASTSVFEFTATADDVAGGTLELHLEGTNHWTNTTCSLKQITAPAATTGGAHIVSANGGSTRNWASIAVGFNPNDIKSYKIMSYASTVSNTRVFKIKIYDKNKVAGKQWSEAWVGESGVGSGTLTSMGDKTISSITKANPGILTVSGATSSGHYRLAKISGLSQMTELNNQYRYLVNWAAETEWMIESTAGYGAAETTGGTIQLMTVPPSTAIYVYGLRGGTLKGWTVAPYISGTVIHSTDLDVYITLER
jgi:hypothetical protein